MRNAKMNEKQTKIFIEWMNYSDNDSIAIYKNLDDVISAYGEEMTERLIEEFLEE